MKISDFQILCGWIEKYKTALSESDSSWDNSYCMRSVIVSLAVNLYKMQSSLTRDCNLPIFTADETITNLWQYELFQEESDLLKVRLYFSIQPDKI